KNDFAGLGPPDLRYPITRVVEQRAGAPADVMNAGGIAVDFAQVRQHRLAHVRVERRGRIVIEIDARHSSNLKRFQAQTIHTLWQRTASSAPCLEAFLAMFLLVF